jgi:hypothetical protein
MIAKNKPSLFYEIQGKPFQPEMNNWEKVRLRVVAIVSTELSHLDAIRQVVGFWASLIQAVRIVVFFWPKCATAAQTPPLVAVPFAPTAALAIAVAGRLPSGPVVGLAKTCD